MSNVSTQGVADLHRLGSTTPPSQNSTEVLVWLIFVSESIRPVKDYRTLRFKNYLKSDLANPPATVQHAAAGLPGTRHHDPTKLFPMDGNDTLGDCTIAAAAHAITTWRGMMKKDSIPATKAVEKLYFHLTGGPDSGLNELDVLNSWRQNGALGEKMLAFATIDPKNHTHVQQAIQLFGGVYLGFQVQQNCVQEFDAHQPWTPGPLTNDGHAVFAVGYDPKRAHGADVGNTAARDLGMVG